MDCFHCNHCFHIPTLSGAEYRRYFITSCSHVLCAPCAERSKDRVCLVCKGGNFKIIEISQGASAEIRSLFSDPLPSILEEIKKCQRVMGFQKAQAVNFKVMAGKMYEGCKKMSNELSVMKARYESVSQEVQSLRQEVSELKKIKNSLEFGGNQGHSPIIFGPGRLTLDPTERTPTPSITRNMFMKRASPSPTFRLVSGNMNGSAGGGGIMQTPRVSPRPFCAAPGAGRPNVRGLFSDGSTTSKASFASTPDLASRLRTLRCSTDSPASVTSSSRY